MAWLRISEVFFVGNGSKELGCEMLGRISQYSLSNIYCLSCRSWIHLSQNSQMADFVHGIEEISYMESAVVHISYTHHMSSWVYSK